MQKRCGDCKSLNVDYAERWDAWYCVHCMRWLEDACGDAACWYCDGRPETAEGTDIWREDVLRQKCLKREDI